MFELNDFVVKATHGVCQIKDIVHLDMPSIDKKKRYYYLVPVSDEQTKVYVPVDQADTLLRYAMNEQAAMDCIYHLKEIEPAWISNEKQREIKYKEAIKSCEPLQLVAIIKNMYERKQQRIASGKSITAVDEKYFKLAENQLFSELSFALHKEIGEMLPFIQSILEE